MKVTYKKIILTLIIIAMFAMLIPTKVFAAGSFSLSRSSASLTTGGTTTITVATANCEGKFSVSSSNSSVATVSTSSFWGDEKGTSITVTAKSAGSATITITPVDVTDTDLNEVTGSKTCKITVSAPVQEKPVTPPTNTGTTTNKPSTNTGTSSKPSTSKPSSNSSSTNKPTTTTPTVQKSSNSKLGSLQIAEGTITPEFSSSVKEYSISVPNEVTKLSISAIPDTSKATVSIKGNEELQVGDNNIEIVVTAEDGSKTTYKILAKRALPELSLQTLTASYIDKNGEKVELILNPTFVFNIYEYVIDEALPHTVKNLEILGAANRENAKIEITGNEELKSGENEITIKVTVANEAGLEEQKTYKIKVQRKEEPVVVPLSPMDKLKNWFSGIGITTSSWISENLNKIITGMLLISTTTLVGLTIYFAYDYKNYQKLLAKLAEINKTNLMERVNVALDPENIESPENISNNTEDIKQEIDDNEEVKLGKGKRFK